MRLVSSKMTFFNKRVFPVIWFGFLIVFIGLSLFSGTGRNAVSPFPFLVVPAFMIVFSYFVMKKLVFDLADEVWDDGDALVVKKSRPGATHRPERYQERELLAVHQSAARDIVLAAASNLW
jgi:hypothetical protein